MFRLSKGAEYAIRSVLYLSRQPEGTICYSEEIAKAQDIPRAYISKIFQSLTRKGIVKSLRGSKGGISLLKAPECISMYDVIVAMEGDIFLNDCLIYAGYCPKDPICPVHHVWKEIQKSFSENLKKANFENLAREAKVLEKTKPCEGKN